MKIGICVPISEYALVLDVNFVNMCSKIYISNSKFVFAITFGIQSMCAVSWDHDFK